MCTILNGPTRKQQKLGKEGRTRYTGEVSQELQIGDPRGWKISFTTWEKVEDCGKNSCGGTSGDRVWVHSISDACLTLIEIHASIDQRKDLG